MMEEHMTILERAAPIEVRGTVVEARGLAVRVADLPVPVGAAVTIGTQRGRGVAIEGEAVGFDRDQTVVMPIGSTSGVRRGDPVVAQALAQSIRVGAGVLGRVLNGRGEPIDGGPPLRNVVARSLYPDVIQPLRRPLIDTPLATGVRAVDALLSVGRGQRLGVIAEPGVGKSVLLGMMARGTSADLNVIALVGERGREVRDFIDNQLGPEGLARSVVVCATGDEPALLRLRAGLVAAAVAEYFRDAGRDVLLIMDSVTRFCQAQREIGLAAGEPPTIRGYPPSVFGMLPRLLERSGRTERGSITGFYAVLLEADPDMSGTDPVADATRGVLDGHLLLSRQLAARGHWPAIDVSRSISRVVDDVTDGAHQSARRLVLGLVGAYQEVEDLVNVGAYAHGSNPDYDLAIACKPVIDRLLQQGRELSGPHDFVRTRAQLLALAQHIEQARGQLDQARRAAAAQPAMAAAAGPS